MAKLTDPISLINVEAFRETLHEDLNQSMMEAAEPILQKALKDIEVKMRERMAALIIARIQRDFNVSLRGEEISITVKQAERK